MRNTLRMLWLLAMLTVLAGCSSGENVIKITYPPNTEAAAVLAVSESWAETESESTTALPESTTAPPEITAAAPETTTAAPETTIAETQKQDTAEPVSAESTYVLNTSSKKFHHPSCSSVPTIKEKNRSDYVGDRADLLARGFVPCKRCNP